MKSVRYAYNSNEDDEQIEVTQLNLNDLHN